LLARAAAAVNLRARKISRRPLPMKRVFQICLLACVYGSLPGAVLANGLRVLSEDSFASARGDAFAATADNSSAIYYNPAGLTQVAGTSLRGGLYGIYLDPTFASPTPGDTYRIGKHYAFIPQVYLSHTLTNQAVSFGLGVFAPFGGSISWPQNTGFRAVATHGSTTYLRINPTIAFQLGDHVSIGGGLSANYARVELEQGLTRFAAPFANDFRFTGHGWAMGGDFGVLVKPWDFLSFGVTMRTATSFTLKGDTVLIDQPFISSTKIPASADVQYPLTATFAVSYRPTPKWNLEFDADYAEWSAFNEITIKQGKTPPFPVQQNVPVKLFWQDSWNYEFGVTRYFDNGWHVSGGYVFSENSEPNTYYTPLAADMDRHFFSVGLGRTGKTFDFDVTYQLGYGPPHTVTGSSPPATPGFFAGQNANGTYKFISHAIFVSAGIHF
jgi:long-chain fatty acid transport protein